jgi:hypothetical protein
MTSFCVHGKKNCVWPVFSNTNIHKIGTIYKAMIPKKKSRQNKSVERKIQDIIHLVNQLSTYQQFYNQTKASKYLYGAKISY